MLKTSRPYFRGLAHFLLYLLWSVISVAVIVMIVVTVLLTAYHDEIEKRLVGGLERISGREVVVDGDFGLRFTPWPVLIANDIKMANSRGGSQPWMLTIDSLHAGLSISALLQGKILLERAEAFHPQVLVERDAKTGKINWIMGSGRTPKPLPWPAENITIENAQVHDAEVRIEVGRISHLLILDSVAGSSDYFTRLINLDARGSLDHRPLKLEIALDNWRSMFLREPTGISFSGLHGETKIHGQGMITDLLRWRGHDIELGITVPSLNELQGWFTTHLIDTPQLVGKARFIQPQRWSSARFEEIDVTSNALDGSVRINGRVDQLMEMNGIDLSGKLQYPLASLMRWKGVESTTDSQLNAQMTLSGDKKRALALNIVSASLLGEGVEISGQGGVTNLLSKDTESIPFQGRADSLAIVGQIAGKQWLALGPIDGSFGLRKKDGRLGLDNIALSSFDKRANLSGWLDDFVTSRQGVFQIDAKLSQDDIERLNQFDGIKLPVFQHSALAGSIEMTGGDFTAKGVELKLDSEGLRITGKGDITDLHSLQIEHADVTLEADSIAAINHQFATRFPELGQLSASGLLQGDINNKYSIKVLDAKLNNKYQSATGSGELQNLGPEMTAKLALSARVRSFENIPALLGSTIELPGQLDGSAQATLVAERADDWSFEEIDIQFKGQNQGSIIGSVKHFPKQAEYAFIADFRRFSTNAFPSFKALDIFKPENVRAYMHITRHATQRYFSVSKIDAHFNLASGAATANVTGSIENINLLEGLDLSVGLDSADIGAIAFFSRLPFKPNTRATALLNFSGKPEQLNLELQKVDVGESDIQGTLTLLQKKGAKPFVSGHLNSLNIDLIRLFKQERHTQLFSDTPLAFDWINHIDAQVDLHAERFNGIIARLSGAHFRFDIKNGILSMPNITAAIGEGSLQAWFTVIAQKQPYNIIVSFKAKKVKPEDINLFGDSSFIRDGLIDIDIGLGGPGNSIAEFMGKTYGKILIELNNSSLKQRNLKLFGADLISGVLDIINNLSGNERYTPLECGVINFPVLQGKAVASQGIAIKTNKVTVLGGGVIDLATEELELIIRPKARKGLGINAGTVTNIAKISGTFERPRIAVDKNSLLQTSATIGAAIVSGGWSLLAQGLLDKNKANSDVCGQTLNEPNASFFKQSARIFRGEQLLEQSER